MATHERQPGRVRPFATGYVAAVDGEPEILALAVVGARARGFNHDAASKLQRLIMAVAELEDLAPAHPEVRDLRAVADGLSSALGELEGLFVEFRALAKGTEVTAFDLRELLGMVARRAGARLELEGDFPAVSVRIREAETIQLLALLCEDGRWIAARATIAADGRHVVLDLACVPSATSLALAARMLGAVRTERGVEISLDR